MPSLRCAPLTLMIWLLGMAAGLAQEAAAPPAERSPWSTLADGAPGLWGCILIAIILTAALLGQLFFVLRKRLVDPPALIDALNRAMHSGNYQEAWETCNHWRQTALGRILQPAMERIGQGRAAVESRLAEESRRESRRLAFLLWCLLGGAAVVVALCAAAMISVLRSVSLGAMSPDSPRLAALALGNAAMLGALAIAVAVPSLAAWSWLRVRARVLLQAADEQGLQLIAGLPYEEIEGVRIGKDFHAGTILGDDAGMNQTGRLQVSKELTTQCPSCNGPINSSRNNCPHCGQLLAWS